MTIIRLDIGVIYSLLTAEFIDSGLFFHLETEEISISENKRNLQ